MLTSPWKPLKKDGSKQKRNSSSKTNSSNETMSSSGKETERPTPQQNKPILKLMQQLDVTVPSRYLCFICGKLQNRPVQLPTCGHRFCKHCFDDYARKTIGEVKCPRDGNVIDRSKVFEDLGWMQTIDDVDVRCPYDNRGCQWQGAVKELEDHLQFECQHQLKKKSSTMQNGSNPISPTSNGKLSLSPIDDPIQEEDLNSHHEDDKGTTKSDDEGESMEMIMDRVEELDLRFDTATYEIHSSKDGKLLWWIPGIDKLLESKNEANQTDEDRDRPIVYSNFIYTGRHGYKLQAIAYPEGTASGKDTHLSLYIMIHSSDYDAILPWPFKQKVRLTLMEFSGNGSGLKKGKCEELVGDRASPSFIKPKSGERNPGWGFPQYSSHEELRSDRLVRDGGCYVLIEVEPFDAISMIR